MAAPALIPRQIGARLIYRFLGHEEKYPRKWAEINGQQVRVPDDEAACRRVADDAWIFGRARLRWRQDQSHRARLRNPLATRYGTKIDRKMAQWSEDNWEKMRIGWALRSGSDIIEMPSKATTDMQNYARLMARAKGQAEMAIAQGMVPRFVTVTLPSQFHSTAGGGTYRNPCWNQSKVEDAARAYGRQWRRFCRRLKGGRGHHDIKIEYFWALQMHRDGCPHWHFVMWASPEDWPIIDRLIREYLVTQIVDAAGRTDAYRVKIENVKGGAGGALAYVSQCVRYVCGTVEGARGGRDADEIKGVASAVGTWRIRRYGFSGKSHGTLWRLAGRPEYLGVDDPQLAPAVEARRAGDWVTFDQIVRREGLAPLYLQAVNKYGEPAKRLAGIRADDVVWMARRWERVRACPSHSTNPDSETPLVLSDKCAQSEASTPEIDIVTPREHLYWRSVSAAGPPFDEANAPF
ncbi:MAG: replication endonuclease [Polycyclovorans sp.]|nr:replication endonuclease [Polycyclovorans sp.]